ncbi:MAG: hypothetical protein Q8N26_38260 [Myxococcales bacterium]|nr:hypothetical protein [Myxococcales bacterium]
MTEVTSVIGGAAATPVPMSALVMGAPAELVAAETERGAVTQTGGLW